MNSGKVYIGTSGWHYAHWVGPFYRTGTRPAEFLRAYAEHLPTVEINNTFYRPPTPETVARWRNDTPGLFQFACKASRYITHVKRLKDGQDSTARFLAAISPLAEKLGPILFQLPPRQVADTRRLTAFLEALPPYHRYAFEFRDKSWFTAATRRLLADRNAALCINDLSGQASPLWQTTDFIYIRLHGPAPGYGGSYDKQALQLWARRIRRWKRAGTDIYCYFNNDAEGHAVHNALALKEMTQ
jgi:uncharacterized protein YecE (DUF72 family)